MHKHFKRGLQEHGRVESNRHLSPNCRTTELAECVSCKLTILELWSPLKASSFQEEACIVNYI